MVKNPPADAGDAGLIPGPGGPLEKKMTTHSSILVWEIPRTESLARQSMVSQRMRHDSVTEQQLASAKPKIYILQVSTIAEHLFVS